jgi:hypothetical protein
MEQSSTSQQMLLDSLVHPPFPITTERRHLIWVSRHQYRNELKRKTIEAKAQLFYDTNNILSTYDCRKYDLHDFECKLLKIKMDGNKIGQDRPTSKFISTPVLLVINAVTLDASSLLLLDEKIFQPSNNNNENKTRFPKPLPEKLRDEEDEQVTMLLQKRGQIATIAKEVVNDVDIGRLRPQQWLNDEVINFYGAMIQARSDADERLLRIHYFSSFFWNVLKRDGYKKGRLSNWTKKVSALGSNTLTSDDKTSLISFQKMPYLLLSTTEIFIGLQHQLISV